LAGHAADFDAQRRCLAMQVAFAVDAGVDVVQVRERDLEAGPLFDLVSDLVGVARRSRTRIVVNDRLDVALAAGADGVHLREDSIGAEAVRRVAPSGFLVGRSVHTAEDAAYLGRTVDYLIAGTVWPTRSKPPSHPLLGPEGLAALVRQAKAPVLAIGGVTLDRVDAAARAGATGVAAIGLFMREPTSADTSVGCGAIPLHDLARRARV
jgi:thiamine-phosphate diphosphorylase